MIQTQEMSIHYSFPCIYGGNTCALMIVTFLLVLSGFLDSHLALSNSESVMGISYYFAAPWHETRK